MRANPALSFLQQPRRPYGPSLVESYARYLLLGAGAYGFPVDLDAVLGHYGLPSRGASLSGQKGALTPDLQIIINTSDRRQVQAYSIAHELMETLFHALVEHDPRWLEDREIEELLDAKERYCDRGAAELLMPMEHFSPLISNTRFCLATAQSLARDSGLSLTAVARRMLETGLRRCALVIWRYGHKPSEDVPSKKGQLNLFGPPEAGDPPKKLRVSYHYRSPGLDCYLKEHKSVEMDTSIGRTFQSPLATLARGYDYLEITDQPGFYLTESIRISFDDQPGVMSLIHFDDRATEQYSLEET